MKPKTRLTITVLTILALSLPAWTAPQQNQENAQDQSRQTIQDCPQNATPSGSQQGNAPSHNQNRPGRQGRQGRGRMAQGQGMGLNQDQSPLTEAEIPLVMAMREEEKLARDVYLTLDAEFISPVFQNIARSEQRHMDAIGRLITAQGLDDPITSNDIGVFTNPLFTELYNSLTEDGTVDYVAALQTGATIEEIDIEDLEEALLIVTQPQLKRIFENLLRGSYNHLRAFAAALEIEGITYTPQILTPEEYDAILNPVPVNNGTGTNNNQNQVGQGPKA